MAAKPTTKSDWTVGNPNFGSVTIEPTGGKKENGWTPSERPAPEYMNWLFYNADQWIKYFESTTDDLLTAFDNLGYFLEVPAGPVNGSNLNFVLSKVPSGDVGVMLDGEWQNLGLGEDYTFNTISNRVEFNAGKAPALGQKIQVLYMTNAGTATPVSGAYEVTGSYSLPQTIVPANGIIVTAAARQKQYVKSQGGVQAITANPQIGAGTADGQELMLYGTSDTNYPTIADGNGVNLNGGPVLMKNNQVLVLTWVAGPNYWSEVSRRS